MNPLIHWLWALFAVSVAAPVGDAPWIGISVSTVLFVLLAAAGVVQPKAWKIAGFWPGLAAVAVGGAAVSLVVGVAWGDRGFAADELSLLLHWAYWAAVLVGTTALVSQPGWGRRTALALAAGVTLLTVLRAAEALLAGRWGAAAPPVWLTQNSYGLGFSTFVPFLLWAALEGPPMRRLVAGAAAALMLAVVVGNASRSSWAASAVGGLTLAAIWLLASRARLAPATTTLLLAALVCVGAGWASAKILQPARERYETLFRLDNDKPFQTRLLLARKAWNLFLEHPWTGVGLGRFAKERVEVARLAEADWMTRTDFHKRSPHNSYAKALAETGLVGFLPLATLWLALGVGGFGAALRLTLAGEGWAAPVYASLLGMSLHLWTISGLTGTAPWFVYGLAAAVIERGRRA